MVAKIFKTFCADFISRSFLIQRSRRQGGPLAPYIFVLCTEILASMIRGNENINEISKSNRNSKITQYADDAMELKTL